MTTFGIIAALLLVLLNGFFVAAEFAVVKLRPTRVEELIRQGSRPARVVQRIQSNLNSYLSATQLGVTLASLGLGSVGEPAIEHALKPLFANLPHDGAFSPQRIIAVAASFLLITYFHIVFGELAPKWLSIGKPDRLALIVALPLELFYRAFYPVVWTLNHTATFLLTRLGIQPVGEGETALSEAELRIALTQSQEGGAIPESAEEIADRAFHFGRGRVRDVMTPRPEVAYLSLKRSLADNLAVVRQTHYARYPLCRDDLDEVVGRVHVRDLLLVVQDIGNDADSATVAARLEAIASPVLFVPEVKPLDAMLDDFRARRMEMAIVQDEYGVTAGVVTLEDVLEELVGEIQQEFAPTQSEVHAEPDGSYIVDAKITLTRLVRDYQVGAEVEGIETLGGYLLASLTANPRVGYTTTLGQWRAEIIELSGRRIRRVRLSPLPIAPAVEEQTVGAGRSSS